MNKKEKNLATHVSFVSIIINILLSIFKMLAGIFARSGAMISDSIHSASDVFTTFIVIIGIKISNKKPDDDHPYGHERIESIAGILLALVLGIIGIGIGYAGIEKIIVGVKGDLIIPGTLALIAAIVSIIVKEWMYWYTRGAAKKVNSSALMADAWHHRSDSLSSIGSLIGIGGAMLGLPIMDPIASVIICFFIIKAAFDILKDATGRLIDKACDENTKIKIIEIIEAIDGVILIDELKTRLFGNKIYIDVEIQCDGNLSLYKSHEIAETVHLQIEELIENVKHCFVHVNPAIELCESLTEIEKIEF